MRIDDDNFHHTVRFMPMLAENVMIGEILVAVERLSRRYGETQAVDTVNFTLERGQVLGFLGLNGAGNGPDLLDQPRRANQAAGYLPEQPPLYRELTVDEQLHYSARLHGLDRAASRQAMARVKERCGLTNVGRRLMGNLSKGYRQRVGIAQALLHDPPVLILDEPTVGLDPVQAREIRALIRALGQERGVILSTHLLPEVQATCSHVQIMRAGRLVFAGALAQLQQRRQSTCVRIGLNAPPPVADLARLPTITRV